MRIDAVETLRPRRATPADVAQRKGATLEFILTGFRQSLSVRHYLFQVIAADRTRRDVSVDADLDMMRRHGISIQEMPLLCRRLLEASEETRRAEVLEAGDNAAATDDAAIATAATGVAAAAGPIVVAEVLVFSDSDMALHARNRAAAKLEQELKRKRPGKPPTPNRQPGSHRFGSGIPAAGASGRGGPGNAV